MTSGKTFTPRLSTAEGAKRAIRNIEEADERAERVNREKAEERLVLDKKLRTERAELAYRALGRNAVGVVALEGSNPDYFLRGLEEHTEKGSGRMIRFPADIGGHRGVSHVVRQMTKLQRSQEHRGLKIVAFEGADYGDTNNGVSSEVTSIIHEIAAACTRRSVLHNRLSLIVVGTGDLANLPGSAHYYDDQVRQPPFAYDLNVIFGLDQDNELSTAPDVGEPTRVTTLKPFAPGNAARANFPATAPPFIR